MEFGYTLKTRIVSRLLATCFLAVAVAFSAFAQTTYIANNNPGASGGTNVFTGSSALTDAMGAATNGDIIYVVPSPTNYGDINIAKQLTLFGGGFNPDKDNAEVSIIGGSARMDISASNVRISGFTIAGIIYLNGNINNITIDKCRFLQLINNGGQAQGNILVSNCIAGENAGNNQYIFNFGLVSSNIIVSNNIIIRNAGTSFGLIQTSNGTTVEHNIFLGSSSGLSFYAFDNFNSGTVKNNIFYGVRPVKAGTGAFTNNNFEYNISFGASDNSFSIIDGNTSLNNIENTDPLFVNLPYGGVYSFTYDPNPQPGSMAIGNGEAGADMGLFGGGSPFDLTGTPLPLVQVLDLPPTIAQGNDLPVNIKGRGN